MDYQILKNIGLSDGESRVYLALVKIGSTTAGPLTDASGVSRSKIYHVLDRLVKKGLVGIVIRSKTKYYISESPNRLLIFMDKKEEELKKNRKEISTLIGELNLMYDKPKHHNEVRIYKGFQGLSIIYNHISEKLKRGDEYVSYGIPKTQKVDNEFWRLDHERRIKAGIKCRLLFNLSVEKKVLQHRNTLKYCEARYMPLPIATPAQTVCYKDATAIILLVPEMMCIEIINPLVQNSFKNYFEYFWSVSKPIKCQNFPSKTI